MTRPDQSALCFNVSSTGIALLVSARPDWDLAVVRLDFETGSKFLRSSVVRKQPLEYEGRTHYLVALRFEATLTPPRYLKDHGSTAE